MQGYIIKVGGREYSGYRDGRPFRLVDAWSETNGLRNCQILSPTGRVVLDNAGSQQVRRDVAWVGACRRVAAAHLREAPYIRTCPRCGVRCWRYSQTGAWWHPSMHGCDLNMFHDYSVLPPVPSHPFEVVAELSVEV